MTNKNTVHITQIEDTAPNCDTAQGDDAETPRMKAQLKRDCAGADAGFAHEIYIQADAEFAAHEIVGWFTREGDCNSYDKLADAITRVAEGTGFNNVTDLKARLLEPPF